MRMQSMLGVALCCSLTLGAQVAIQGGGTDESLVLQPGDLVHITVLQAPELEQHARVTDSGELPLIVGGSVKVSGLTVAQAVAAIQTVLRSGDFVVQPYVSVSLEQNAALNVTVLGEVRVPGSYPIQTPRSILAVLALAGGLNEAADRTLTVQRRGTKDRVSYFVSNNADVAIDASVTVNPGDTVVVPKASIVYILGDVGRPGGYPMATNDSRLSVLQAVALAGSTAHSAVPSHSRLIRRRPDGSLEDLPLPLSAMQKGKAPDMQLQADDIIYVPFSYLRSMAMGASSLVAAASSAAIYRF